MFFDLPPEPKLWVPPKPAIIRSGGDLAPRTKNGWFLPAFLPSTAAPPAPLSFTNVYFAAVGSTTSAPTIPATTQADDIILLWATGGSTATAGWTAVWSSSGITCACVYFRATGNHSGSAVTWNSSQGFIWAIFRASKAITTLTKFNNTPQITSSTPSAQTLTISSLTAGGVILIGQTASTATGAHTRTWSPAFTAERQITAFAVQNWARYHIYGTTPANTTISMTDGGQNNTICTGYIYCT